MENTRENAQWHLERGLEQKRNIWLWVLFIPIPIFIPFALIYGIVEYRQGKIKMEIGETMNEEAGRENYIRPRGIASNMFQRGYSNGPDTRYHSVPLQPPS